MQIIKIKLSVSNAYLVKGQKSILVDAGAPNEADKILAAVKSAGVDEKDISPILHTHGHIDHAGSTAELKRRLGVPVAIQQADAFMLKTGTNGVVKPRNLEAKLVAAMLVKPFEPVEPDLTLDKEISLEDFGDRARLKPSDLVSIITTMEDVRWSTVHRQPYFFNSSNTILTISSTCISTVPTGAAE